MRCKEYSPYVDKLVIRAKMRRLRGIDLASSRKRQSGPISLERFCVRANTVRKNFELRNPKFESMSKGEIKIPQTESIGFWVLDCLSFGLFGAGFVLGYERSPVCFEFRASDFEFSQ
jgi:hypothetical protein